MSYILDNHKELTQVTTLENVSLSLMNWGRTNAFPQTLKNLVEQSPNAKPAVERTATFLKGGTFEGENTVVGLNGETLKDIVAGIADDYALFRALSIHANYNIKGKVSTMQVMEIPTQRFNTFDTINYANKIGYHPNFALNSEVVKANTHSVTAGEVNWLDRFNPDPEVVTEQIKQCPDGLIDNYGGQVLYISNAGYSKYPISPLQAQINFVLSDIENSILVRKETSTGFVDTYIFKTTKNPDDDNVIDFQTAVMEAQGARGMGKIIRFAGLTDEEMKSNILERIESDKASIMDSSIKTFELTKGQINGAYLIPPALAGIDQESGFSGEDLEEAYRVFNAITQDGRNVIENAVNRVLAAGSFGVKSIKLQPMKLEMESKEDEEETVDDVTTDSNEAENQTLTNLTGKQMQGVMRIVRKYNKEDDDMNEGMARAMLKSGFGMDDEMINTFLGVNQETVEEDV